MKAKDQQLHKALDMARRALTILEEQAAGYGSLEIPVNLRIQLEDKRREVAELAQACLDAEMAEDRVQHSRTDQQYRPQRAHRRWVLVAGAIIGIVLLLLGWRPVFNWLSRVTPAATAQATATATRNAQVTTTSTPPPTPAATKTPTPTATATATPKVATAATPPLSAQLGDIWTRPADDMVMVYVPAGEFQMGSETGGDDEKPVHTVAVDGFWLDRTEVSVAQFRDFVSATRYETTAEQAGESYVLTGDGWNQVSGADWAHPEGPSSQAVNDHPVVQVSRNDAVAYCEWAGARLPTEAEWEYATRGPEELTYPWGNTFDGTRLNFCDKNCTYEWADKDVDDGYKSTAPVGSYPDGASWVGALDLAGNVYEWVADWYGNYPSGRQVNPTGPQSGETRVLRGGSWIGDEWLTRGAVRYWLMPPSTVYYLGGFRCGVSAASGE